MLGVSRTSVRDALKQLTDTGYLEVRRGRNGGYFVLANWGPASADHVRRQLVANWSEFEQIFDARRLIEPLIARTAAVRRTKRDIAECRRRFRPISTPRITTRRGGPTRRCTLPSRRRRTIRSWWGCRRPARQDHAQSRRRTLHRRGTANRHRPASGARRRGVRRARRRRRRHRCAPFHAVGSSCESWSIAPSTTTARSATMSRQLVFVLRRLLLTIPMLFVMSVVVFLIIRLVPGDPVRTMLGFRATDANVAELRAPARPRPEPVRPIRQLGRRAAARRSRHGYRQPRAALRTSARSACRSPLS